MQQVINNIRMNTDFLIAAYPLWYHMDCACSFGLDSPEQALIQPFLCYPVGHKIRNFEIIQIRKWKVRIAAYPYFRQMHDCGIAAMTIYGIGPQFCHRQTDSPIVLAWILGRFSRDIVTVIDDDRNLGQFYKSAKV